MTIAEASAIFVARLRMPPADLFDRGRVASVSCGLSMETVQTIWGFLLLGSVLVFPQLLGVLLFFLLKGRPHFLAHALSFVAPFLLSIFFVWLIYMYRYYQANPDERCGGPMLGAVMIMLFSGCLQLVMGAGAQVALHSRSAICARRYSAVR